jgi:hypothetical protein
LNSNYIEQQLVDSMEKLAIAEGAREQAEQRAAKAERKAIRVSKFMNRITIREVKMEWIYIGTTRIYSLERLFKIGSTTRLTSRIPQYGAERRGAACQLRWPPDRASLGGVLRTQGSLRYNTGRPGAADPFYYAWAIKCYNARDLG